MSMHEEICQQLRELIPDSEDVRVCAIDLSPTDLARLCFRKFEDENIDPHVEYAAIEHYKTMARKILSAHFDPDGESNPAHASGQADMFSGMLQERYPIRRTPGADPVYRPLGHLSLADLDWNIDMLKKSAGARLAHADALKAHRNIVAMKEQADD